MLLTVMMMFSFCFALLQLLGSTANYVIQFPSSTFYWSFCFHHCEWLFLQLLLFLFSFSKTKTLLLLLLFFFPSPESCKSVFSVQVTCTVLLRPYKTTRAVCASNCVSFWRFLTYKRRKTWSWRRKQVWKETSDYFTKYIATRGTGIAQRPQQQKHVMLIQKKFLHNRGPFIIPYS